MNDPLQALLQPPATPAFGTGSRYSGLPTATHVAPDGTVRTYVRRRFVPPGSSLTLLREHVVMQGDRLDNLAAAYIGDPEQFWRICDANDAVAPDELTDVPGRRLRITLPAPAGAEGAPRG